jgi:hypothetical protein
MQCMVRHISLDQPLRIYDKQVNKVGALLYADSCFSLREIVPKADISVANVSWNPCSVPSMQEAREQVEHC